MPHLTGGCGGRVELLVLRNSEELIYIEYEGVKRHGGLQWDKVNVLIFFGGEGGGDCSGGLMFNFFVVCSLKV